MELASISKALGKNQSELIREAIDSFIDRASHGRREVVLREAAGIWKNRKDLHDLGGKRNKWDRDHS